MSRSIRNSLTVRSHLKNNMDGSSDLSLQLLNSSVCRVCQSLGDLGNPRGALVGISDKQHGVQFHLYTYMHHPSVAALVRSAGAGCSICTVLCHGLRLFKGTEFDQAAAAVSPALTTASAGAKSITDAERSDDEVATHLAELVKSKNPSAKLDLGDTGKGRIIIQNGSLDELGLRGTRDKFYGSVHFLTANPLSGHFSGFQTSYDQFDPCLEHRPSQHLLSDPHIDLINDWRKACKEKHASCRKTIHDQQLPRRVLELDPNKEDGVRLIDTHGRKQGTYACLSYCWGVSKTQAGQTNRSNLSTHLQGIPLHNLPSTVIDTIRLFRKLRFQYLWVDRLCIIQDDEEDWVEESSKMCDIYSGSALTISVPICNESSQSFLEQRLGRCFSEQSQFGVLEFADERSNLKSSLWMRPLSRETGPWIFEQTWQSFCRVEKDESNWLGRGWTFQEWMLSPRVLHIDRMTIWDCLDGYANELNQRGMRGAHLSRNPREFGRVISWKSIVEEYSKRGIAHEKDRLPALAGLAERYRRETRYTYLAGMWLEEMPLSLLWQADPRFSTNRRELVNQPMPSWSWAHCNRPVTFFLNDRRSSSEATIKSHHCRYKPPSSISMVVEAWIDVYGSLSVPRVVIGKEKNQLLVGKQSWASTPDNENWDLEDAIKQDKVQLLLLASVEEPSRSYSLKHAAVVLQRYGSNDVSPLCFRRVGIATQTRSGSKNPIEEPLWKKQVVRLL